MKPFEIQKPKIDAFGFYTFEAFAKVLFCHSRGSNRESSFFEKQKPPIKTFEGMLLDTRFHGYDGKSHLAGTSARTSLSVLSNNKGIALIMVMILSLISLAIMSGLIYMVTSGTQVSGIEKRYRTALEAGKSGKDIAYQFVAARGNPYSAAEAALFNFNITASDACMNTKLNNPTYISGAYNWGGCNSSIDMITLPVPNPATYDMTFSLGNNPAYTVYAKIVDTVEGNSSIDEGLEKTGVVISNSGEVTVVSVPYLYTIEIVAENAANSMERSRLSVLYQY